MRDGHLAVQIPIGPRLRDALLAIDLEEIPDDERFTLRIPREQHRDE